MTNVTLYHDAYVVFQVTLSEKFEGGGRSDDSCKQEEGDPADKIDEVFRDTLGEEFSTENSETGTKCLSE